jgi:hypothetical protein
MMITRTYRVRGISPMILHNGQLANPLNEHAKALKAVTGKRKKTDSDYEEMARIEWKGGLYLDEKERPIFPAENIEAAILAAAAKLKLKSQIKPSLLVDDPAVITHDGPKTLAGLAKDKRFVDTRGVRNPGSGSRVMRTRPIFHRWELEFDVSFDDEDINPNQMDEIVRIAGKSIGFSDYRPKFGRFEVVEVKELAMA